ncbi:MAG: carbohydrate ABC transporter permease [Candidatus Bathyarchaeia archaeon]
MAWRKESKLFKALKYVAVIAVVLVMLVPYLFTIVASLMPEPQLIARPPFPFKSIDVSLSNYIYVLRYAPFNRAFLYSAAVAVLTTCFVLVAGSMGAYAVAHIRFPGNNAMFNFIVVAYMLPGLAMLIPIVVLLKTLGLLDTLIGMVFAHSVILLPLMTWFLIGIYESVPRDIDEALRIDGYSRIKVLFREVIPLARFGFFLILIFSFINSWNDLMFANTVGIVQVQLLQPRILEFMSGARVLYTQLAAAGILSSLPVIVLAIVLQKQIIAGIMRGAIK